MSCGHASTTSFSGRFARCELLVPYADGGCLSELHSVAGHLTRSDTPEGVLVRALIPARLAERFARFAVAPQAAAGL